MILKLLWEEETNHEKENLLAMKPQPKQPAFREHFKRRGFVRYKARRARKHRPRRQLKWRKLFHRCGGAGANFYHGEPRIARAVIGLDFGRCNSHGDKDLVFQQAAASYINYNGKHGETKRF